MRTYLVGLNGNELRVRIETDGALTVEGRTPVPQIRRVSDREFSVIMGDRQVKVIAVRNGKCFAALADGFCGTVTVETERTRLMRLYAGTTGASAREREVRAPMPALILRIDVDVGLQVTSGQSLLVLEAMKMENEIKAGGPGCVKEIYVKTGKVVEKGELLLLLE